MNNPIQIIRDFRKRRKMKREQNLIDISVKIAFEHYPFYSSWDRTDKFECFREGLIYGIAHRKEILKQVRYEVDRI